MKNSSGTFIQLQCKLFFGTLEECSLCNICEMLLTIETVLSFNLCLCRIAEFLKTYPQLPREMYVHIVFLEVIFESGLQDIFVAYLSMFFRLRSGKKVAVEIGVSR